MKLRLAAFLADASSRPVRTEGAAESTTFTARGYSQTREPAARGGKANRRGFRFRNASMRALAASFRGQPFVTGHEWGDVRARGGTITDARVEEYPGELAILYDIEANVDWAREGLENGTIERFSIGAIGKGSITCTIHGAPVWTKCLCMPGELVEDLVAEWEYEGADGVELSCVNVAAVDGTSIVDLADGEPLSPVELAAICGRARPAAAPIVIAPIAAAAEDLVLRAQLDQGVLELAAERERTAHLEAQLGRVHVDTELARLRSSRVVSEELVAGLRESASGPGGRVAFDAALRLVTAAAPPALGPDSAPMQRGRLQSDASPATFAGDVIGQAPDAYEQNCHNPNLPRLMKLCGITTADVRKHGTATVNVVPELAAVVRATELRGA